MYYTAVSSTQTNIAMDKRCVTELANNKLVINTEHTGSLNGGLRYPEGLHTSKRPRHN